MGQTQTKEEKQEKVHHSTKSSFKAKKYLTRVELVSLQYIYKDLKTAFPDGFSCIEAKQFLVKSLFFFFNVEIKINFFFF